MNKQIIQSIFWITLLILAFVLGILLTRWYFTQSQTVRTEDAAVMLEKVKSVTKLTTLEGYFSEIYDYEDYYGYDLGVFRKKALIRVKAKVSIGYNLEEMQITTYPEERVVSIRRIPPPELLSIEHDLDYYDIQEGMFNQFSKDDYNRLNANAKEFIRQKAQESDLFDAARLKRNNLYEMIRLMVESSGWKLEVEEENENEN